MAAPPSAAGSARVQPRPPAVKGHYFTTSPGQFQYPELSSQGDFGVEEVRSRPNFGVALAGGGFRAATLAAGCINGLRQLGVMNKVRYLSSNSGASWFNAALSYQPGSSPKEAASSDDDPFFIEYQDPKQLKLEAINTSPRADSFLHIITDNNALPIFAEKASGELGNNPGTSTAWSQAVGDTFLAPFGLDSLSSTVSMAGTNGQVYEGPCGVRDRFGGQADIYLAKPGPFPLLVGSVYHRNDTKKQFYPFEFTPLYFGMPSLHPDAKPIPLGGGYTEPYMADSCVPEQLPLQPSPDGTQVTTVNVNNLVPLALMSGISSAFFAAGVYKLGAWLVGRDDDSSLLAVNTVTASNNTDCSKTAAPGAAPHANKRVVTLNLNDLNLKDVDMMDALEKAKAKGKGPASAADFEVFGPAVTELLGLFGFEEGNVRGHKMTFADGGGNDNLALYPMLRRKVAHIVLLVASDASVNDPSFGEGDSYDYDKAAKDHFFDVAMVFGALPAGEKVYGIDTETFNGNSQVFDKAGWKELVDVMRKNVSSGKPATFRQTYTVMGNAFQFVQGGWEVDILWVWNQQCTSWEQQLPQDTQAQLYSDRHSVPMADVVPAEGILDWLLKTAQGLLAVKNLGTYPTFTTLASQVCPAAANLLYQQAGWLMKEGAAKDILAMIAAAEGEKTA